MLARITRGFPSFTENFTGRDYLPGFPGNNGYRNIPAVNVVENNDSFMIEVAAPGLDKKEFSISLDHDILTVSSEKEHKAENSDERYTCREFSYDSFSRRFSLPESVDTEKIRANHINGILYINIPKKEEARVKPAREIAVS